MVRSTDLPLSSDRPVEKTSQDRLGFAVPAAHIAKAIMQFPISDGLVIGIEGVWGSGKSSFINLTTASLNGLPDAPEIVRFSPWLISARDKLLEELFHEIRLASEKIFPKIGSEKQKEDLSKALNKFSGHLGRTAEVLQTLEDVHIPYAATARKLVQGGAKIAKSFADKSSIEDQKKKLKKELQKLDRKIVIVIDDLDRLEPSEAAEVVRLVKAVADFPNIIYLLCYDRKILAHSLKTALSLEDGSTYLEKTVQVTYSVPQPEDFDLRQWFKKELSCLYPEKFIRDLEAPFSDELQRLLQIIDSEGGRTLTTPRTVVRSLNAMSLYASPVIKKIDIADMTWLQFIRLRNPELFNWVEKYLNNAASVIKGATISKPEKESMLAELKALIEGEGRELDDVLFRYRDILPGIEYAGGTTETKWSIFKGLGKSSIAHFIKDRRLGSPQHYRLYFALSEPSDALTDEAFTEFLSKCASKPADATKQLIGMAKTPRSMDGTFVDLLLDRLEGDGIKALPVKAVTGLLLALANAMDVAALGAGKGMWGEYWVWGAAARVFKASLDKLPPASRLKVITTVFSKGKALAWLSSLLRAETYAHGRYGDRPQAGSEWVLSDPEYDAAIGVIFKRFEAGETRYFLGSPDFLGILFFWRQAGGEKEAGAYAKKITASDGGLLSFLEASRSWSSANGKVYYPVRKNNIQAFIDFDVARKRVEKISRGRNKTLKKKAAQLLPAFAQGLGDD